MNLADPNTSAPGKPWWKSKTILLNIIALVSLMVPQVADWLKKNPEQPLAVLAALNLVVRFVTSGKIALYFDDDDTSGNSSTGGSGPSGGSSSGTGMDSGVSGFSPSRSRLLIWLVGAVGAVVSLFPRRAAAALLLMCAPLMVSCTPQQLAAFKAVPITIGIEGQHGTYGYSSKGGLVVTVKPKVREEKSAPDFGKILAREWEAGRYMPSPIPVPVEVWPPSPPKPRRMVLP